MRISDPSGASATRARRHRRSLRLSAAAVSLTVLATVTGCDLADADEPSPTPQKGGTLYLNIQSGLDILDPQRTYSAIEMNVLRLHHPDADHVPVGARADRQRGGRGPRHRHRAARARATRSGSSPSSRA